MKDSLKDQLRKWIPIILLSPFVLIIVVTLMIKLFVWLSSHVLPNITLLRFDLSEGMSIFDYLTLYAAFAGIGVTLFLGIAIFSMTEEKENIKRENEINSKKKIIESYLNDILKDATNAVFDYYIKSGYAFNCSPGTTIHTFDKPWMDSLFLLRDSLGDDSFNYLYNLFNTLKRDVSFNSIVDKICLPFIKYMSLIDARQIDRIEDIIHKDLYKSLCLLRNEKNVSSRKCNYKNGKRFYEETSTPQGIRYVVYNIQNSKIFDAVFTNENKYTGYMTFYNEMHKIIKQGDFLDSRLVSGELYDARCNEDGTFRSEPSRKRYIPRTEDEYNKSKALNRSGIDIVADFSINNGKYDRVSDIQYAEIIVM